MVNEADAEENLDWNGRPNLLPVYRHQRIRLLPAHPYVTTICRHRRLTFAVVYAALGMSGPTILLITGINGALGVVVTGIFITFILDRVGRKSPLIFGAIGMAVCLAIEAAINAKWGGENANNPAAQRAGIAFIIVSHHIARYP